MYEGFFYLLFSLVEPNKKAFKDEPHPFRNIKVFLRQEARFIKEHGRSFEKEVCNLVALQLNAEKVSYEKKIFDIFEKNMYKFYGFRGAMKFLKTEFSETIESYKNGFNFTNAKVSALCNNSKVPFWLLESMCHNVCLSVKITPYHHHHLDNVILVRSLIYY